jgi:hypothetical protein
VLVVNTRKLTQVPRRCFPKLTCCASLPIAYQLFTVLIESNRALVRSCPPTPLATYLQSNTLNHLVESHVGTSRDAIKVDLVDKIVYDDLAVFRRLRVERVSTNLVTACAASFNAENTEDIKLLKELVERASKKTPEALEFEEINDTANDLNKEEKSGNHGSAEEKKMYDPLVCDILSECLPFS